MVDGRYRSLVGDLVWRAADTVVWLDPPRWASTASCLGRTVRRALTREVLWNGNRERLRNLLSFDPDVNIVFWAWTTQPGVRAELLAASIDPAWAHLRFVRLRSRREVAVLIDSVDA